MTYVQMARILGACLGEDPQYLSFYTYPLTTTRVLECPIASTTKEWLSSFLPHTMAIYEKLEEPLRVIETKVTCFVHWRARDTMETIQHTIYLYKTDLVSYLMSRLAVRVELVGTKKIRVMQIQSHRTRRVYCSHVAISELFAEHREVGHPSSQLRNGSALRGSYLTAEEVLLDEVDAMEELEEMDRRERPMRKDNNGVGLCTGHGGRKKRKLVQGSSEDFRCEKHKNEPPSATGETSGTTEGDGAAPPCEGDAEKAVGDSEEMDEEDGVGEGENGESRDSPNEHKEERERKREKERGIQGGRERGVIGSERFRSQREKREVRWRVFFLSKGEVGVVLSFRHDKKDPQRLR